MKTNLLHRSLTTIHISLAILWIYQGVVPKLIFQVHEEHIFWQALGVQDSWISFMIQLSGIVEVIFGLLFIISNALTPSKRLHYLNILAMIFFCIVVMILYPQYYAAAFNPFVMNIAMAVLSIVALQILSTSDKT